jgi:2-oxoglutarate/2-oxoacid ferredoxin oxidoreductase subunit beta
MSALSKSSFSSDNEVRWCPGCGDYAILAAMQRFLPSTGLQPEDIVFVSGIGCAGRFPYYMNTYGFHTIHGRAPAVATGIKMMKTDLSVWLITGDGDGLSIGMHHLLHCLRRNININILLLNNQVYGLTKGQSSPTSPVNQITKTTPTGEKNHPLNPIKLALSAGATFVARGLDKDPKHLAELFAAANAHEGTSFIEIYQNCPIFNDGAFETYDNKRTREQHVTYLSSESKQVLSFGGVENREYLCFDNDEWHITNVESEASIYQQHSKTDAYRLAELPRNNLPLPLGVFYQSKENIYSAQKKEVKASYEDLEKLF